MFLKPDAPAPLVLVLLTPWNGLSSTPGEGNGYLLQHSGLENSMDCIVHGVAKSWTRLSDVHFHIVGKTIKRKAMLSIKIGMQVTSGGRRGNV